jgi:hypothetical protein
MPSFGKLLGKDVYIMLDDNAIECTTEVSEEHTASEIDVSCKNTTGSSDFLPGQKTSTYNVSGIRTDGTTSNKDYKALRAAWLAGTVFTLYIGGVDTGDDGSEQEAFITNLSSSSGGNESPTTWSATLKGKGTLTAVTYA